MGRAQGVMMNRNAPLLIADIGGTNVRFAVVSANGTFKRVWSRKCADFPDLRSAVVSFLEQLPSEDRPHRGAFAIACPTEDDRIHMTNLDWSFSASALREQLGFDSLHFVNDSAALAYATPHLHADGVRQVGGGVAVSGAPIGIIGPGTGLGVTALIANPSQTLVLQGEGGHVSLPASNEIEDRIVAQMRDRFGHVSAERALSGPGLVNLFKNLAGLSDETSIDATPESITAKALAEPNSVQAQATDLFCAMLGTVASDLALSLGAHGGIYIAGGIVNKLGSYFDQSDFRQRFETKGRFSDYVSAIPTFVITHPNPALIGLCKQFT